MMIVSRNISFAVILVCLVIYSETYNNVSYKKIFDSLLYYSSQNQRKSSTSNKISGNGSGKAAPKAKRMVNTTAMHNQHKHQNYSKNHTTGGLHTQTHIWTNETLNSAVIIIREEESASLVKEEDTSDQEAVNGKNAESSMKATATTTKLRPLLDDTNKNKTTSISLIREPQVSLIALKTQPSPATGAPNTTTTTTTTTSKATKTTGTKKLAATKANTNSSCRRRNITMIVALSGELGNNLLHLIQAYAVKLHIEEKIPNITVDLVGEHQNAGKWIKPAKDIHQCFINLRKFDFSSGQWVQEDDPFKATEQQQMDWLKRKFNGKESPDLLQIDKRHSLGKVIENLRTLLQQQQDEPNNQRIQPNKKATKVSLPYLRHDAMGGHEGLVEKYLIKIQQWLAFDSTNPNCCGVLPAPDEGVFHFRNFAAESKGLRYRFVEVGPKHVQQMLEKNLIPNHNITKVAFITRHYPHNPRAANKHIRAIQQSDKLRLRVIPEQTGVQDFCLLLHAKHVVATRLSSYAKVAGILGNQTSVLDYVINTKERKSVLLKPKPMKSTVLANRFKYEIYPDEWRY